MPAIIQFSLPLPANVAVAYITRAELQAVVDGRTGRLSARYHPVRPPLPSPGRIRGIATIANAADDGVLRGPRHTTVRHRALNNASAALDMYVRRADAWLRTGGDANDLTELDVANARDAVQRLELACNVADADGIPQAAREWFAMAGRLRAFVARLEQSLGR